MTGIIISTAVSWLVTFICAGVTGYVTRRYKQAKDEREKKRQEDEAREEAQKKGLRSLLRAEIIRQHDKHTERGFCPIYAKEAITDTYESYHELGGNGVVTKLYKDIMALPEEANANKKGGK